MSYNAIAHLDHENALDLASHVRQVIRSYPDHETEPPGSCTRKDCVCLVYLTMLLQLEQLISYFCP